MRGMKLPALLAAVITIVTPLVCVAQTERPNAVSADDPTAPRKTRGVGITDRYYDDRERGWHFFEEDPDRQEQEPMLPPIEGVEQTPPTGPAPFSVEWLRVEMEEAKVKAIDEPTRENIEYYSYLEKVAMDKAEKFALMRQQVSMVNPGLDETIDNPVTTIARTARRDEQSSEQTRILEDLARNVGIYYFFKSTCEYCAKQNIPLLEMKKRFGFSILPISVDGLPMPDGVFNEWTPDQGQAAMLSIDSTPTLYMVRPPNEVVLLSVGVQTSQGLEKRLLQVAHANKWIDQETFEKAMRGLPRRFLVDAIQDMGAVNWDDPKAALDALRYATSRGTEKTTVDEMFGTDGQATRLDQ